MSDLVEFLLARIAEDEESAISEQADAMVGFYWKSYPQKAYEELQSRVLASSSRILTECEAKRAIVELHGPVEEQGVTVCSECGPDEDVPFRVEAYGRGWPCPTMRALARVYADHPDYREEWRP